MIRLGGQYNRRVRKVVPPGTKAAVKAQPEPIPGVTVRCECGEVVRVKSNGKPRAHNYCRFAPPSVA